MSGKRKERTEEEEQVEQCASFDEIVKSKRIDPDGVEVYDRGDAMGRGVRTKRAFKRRQIVCSYGGKCYRLNSKEDIKSDSDYKYLIVKNIVVDGAPNLKESRGHTGAFINDANGPIRSPEIKNNVRFSNGSIRNANGVRKRAVWVRAERDLAAGEELWLAYGKDYWQSREMIAKQMNKT